MRPTAVPILEEFAVGRSIRRLHFVPSFSCRYSVVGTVVDTLAGVVDCWLQNSSVGTFGRVGRLAIEALR